ncbi:MAG: type II secretion system F family protein [Candidatus Peregrinibacteria bacterium]
MEDINKKPVESEDYVIEGAGSGTDVLARVKMGARKKEDEVIYGVYNNAGKGFFVKLNDFLIDRSKISLRDKSYFFHMLAVMVDAGIPVVAAVKSLAGRSENPKFKRVLRTIAYNCEQGASLSDAMTRFDEVFDDAEIGIVKSGEATGRLHVMLFKLSEQLDKKHELSMKLWGAAVYPIAVLSVLILVMIGMLVWIFPTLLTLLKEGGISEQNLPLATKILIGLQNAVVNYWWAILLVIFGVYGLFNVYLGSDRGAVRWDYVKLRMPVVGTLLRKIFVLRFVSLLGLLIESGLPVIRAIKIAGTSLSNRVYRLKAQEVINFVSKGGKISDSMADSTFLFPPEIVEMIRVGEASANLAKVSEKVSDQYEREIDNSLKKLSSVFEPLMILIVGVFVALLALAIMAPIFNLSSTVGT